VNHNYKANAAWNDYVYNNTVDELNEKINSLIEAGNELRDCASRIGTVAAGEASVIRRTQEAIQAWEKEAKP
jgi:hypothetical protein